MPTLPEQPEPHPNIELHVVVPNKIRVFSLFRVRLRVLRRTSDSSERRESDLVWTPQAAQ